MPHDVQTTKNRPLTLQASRTAGLFGEDGVNLAVEPLPATGDPGIGRVADDREHEPSRTR
jgi:hypothetical protein